MIMTMMNLTKIYFIYSEDYKLTDTQNQFSKYQVNENSRFIISKRKYSLTR